MYTCVSVSLECESESWVSVCIYICVCLCVHVYAYVCESVRALCMYVYIYTNMCECMCVCVFVGLLIGKLCQESGHGQIQLSILAADSQVWPGANLTHCPYNGCDGTRTCSITSTLVCDQQCQLLNPKYVVSTSSLPGITIIAASSTLICVSP